MTKEVHWYDKYLLGKLTSGHGESHCLSLNIKTGRSCPLLCTANQTKIDLSFFFFNTRWSMPRLDLFRQGD